MAKDNKGQIQGSNRINSESASNDYIKLNINNQYDNNTNEESEPKLRGILVGIKGLSLGISIIVALLVGVGIGILLKNIFDVFFLFWVGVFWGICAAILNVYKAYKSQLREFDKLANDPKYSYKNNK